MREVDEVKRVEVSGSGVDISGLESGNASRNNEFRVERSRGKSRGGRGWVRGGWGGGLELVGRG